MMGSSATNNSDGAPRASSLAEPQYEHGRTSSPKSWQRFYLGYRERFVDDCCVELECGKTVRVQQAPSAKPKGQQQQQQQQQRRRQQQKPAQQQQHRGSAGSTRGRGGRKLAAGRHIPHPPQQQQQQPALDDGDDGSEDKRSDPALTGSTVWDGAVVLAQYLTCAASPLWPWMKQQQQQQRQQDARQQEGQEQHEAGHDGGSPCGTGEAAAAQEQQQQQQQQHHRHAPTCLELGAGTGLVSLCLLAAGAVDFAVLTDIPGMLPQLRANVQHNASVLPQPARALVAPLRWGEAGDVAALQQQQPRQQRSRAVGVPLVQQQQQQQLLGGGVQQLAIRDDDADDQPEPLPQLQPPFDLIVGSDLIYYSYSPATPHSRLLLLALAQLAGPATLIFLALSLHHNPGEVSGFLRWAARDWGFEVLKVQDGVPREYVVPDVLVVRLRLVDCAKAAAAAAAAAAGTLQRADDAGGDAGDGNGAR